MKKATSTTIDFRPGRERKNVMKYKKYYLEPTEEKLKELDKMAHDWFTLAFEKGTRETIGEHYRALCRLNKALAVANENVTLFDDILSVIEDLLPAYGRKYIIDENGDINNHYHDTYNFLNSINDGLTNIANY